MDDLEGFVTQDSDCVYLNPFGEYYISDYFGHKPTVKIAKKGLFDSAFDPNESNARDNFINLTKTIIDHDKELKKLGTDANSLERHFGYGSSFYHKTLYPSDYTFIAKRDMHRYLVRYKPGVPYTLYLLGRLLGDEQGHKKVNGMLKYENDFQEYFYTRKNQLLCWDDRDFIEHEIAL